MSNVTKNTAELESAFLVSPSKQIRGYRIGNQPTGYVQFNLTHKPKWIHRQFMRILLGWYWYDSK
jgi:hypothetical protein